MKCRSQNISIDIYRWDGGVDGQSLSINFWQLNDEKIKVDRLPSAHFKLFVLKTGWRIQLRTRRMLVLASIFIFRS